MPGIRTRPGEVAGTLREPLADLGYEVSDYDTPYRPLCFASRSRRFTAMTLAREIDRYFGRDILLIEHSDGAAAAQDAMPLIKVKPRSLVRVSINGALDRDAACHEFVSQWDVLYDVNDGWLSIARLIPFGYPWGGLGQTGHDLGFELQDPPEIRRRFAGIHGLDPRITNIEIGDGTNTRRDHVKAFDRPAALAERIAERHLRHLMEIHT
ncbi:MAG: hypothetical protein AAGI54_04655 [Planctomycetota bacterium]